MPSNPHFYLLGVAPADAHPSAANLNVLAVVPSDDYALTVRGYSAPAERLTGFVTDEGTRIPPQAIENALAVLGTHPVTTSGPLVEVIVIVDPRPEPQPEVIYSYPDEGWAVSLPRMTSTTNGGAKPEGPVCESPFDLPGMGQVKCTRDPLHLGSHLAMDNDGECLAIWDPAPTIR